MLNETKNLLDIPWCPRVAVKHKVLYYSKITISTVAETATIETDISLINN